ncbi:MAG: hypothetical protein ABIN36_19415 [Ferruginibacter sp.]
MACCGCKTHSTKHDFYSYSKSFDLWRLPILGPYELISPSNPGGWFLLLEDSQFKNPDFFETGKGFQVSNIETIGILDSVIVIQCPNIYWPKLSGSYSTTVIIDTKKNNFIYSNQHHQKEIASSLTELGIHAIKLYQSETVLKPFLADFSLPPEWRL